MDSKRAVATAADITVPADLTAAAMWRLDQSMAEEATPALVVEGAATPSTAVVIPAADSVAGAEAIALAVVAVVLADSVAAAVAALAAVVAAAVVTPVVDIAKAVLGSQNKAHSAKWAFLIS